MSNIARPLWLVLLAFVLGSPSNPLFAGNNDHVVIVLDDSGSMREVMKRDRRSRIDAAKSSLTKVIEQIAPETNVGLLLLNGEKASNHWYIPIGPV
ncbi:MAG: VWA domain-containing protein, partial [Pirellula sp.]